MNRIESFSITPTLKLLNLNPPIHGYDKFIGAYLFHGEKAAIVDVGPKAAISNLLLALTEHNVKPEDVAYIILTHIHLDHAGGVGTVIKELDQAKVVAHQRARSHLIDPTLLWKASRETLGDLALKYGEMEPVPEDRIVVAEDGMKLDLGGGLVPEVYLTPGHAPHHLSLFDRASGVLIAGEGAGVCINGTLRVATAPPFRLEETLSSIDKLIALGPARICYGHFGCYDNATERLKTIRQKVLTWYEIVNSEARLGKSAEDILLILKEKDRDLDYLNSLTQGQYNREYLLLLNSIRGMAESGKANR